MSTYRVLRLIAIPAFAAVLAVACHHSMASDEMSMEAAKDARTFDEQVSAGETQYTLHCANCHGGMGQGDKAPRVVGLKDGALPVDPPADRKVRKTRFYTVADVADFVTQNMPADHPGRLSSDVYWAILAFDLHANGIDLKQKLTPQIAKTTTIPR